MTRWRLETAPEFERAARKLDPTTLRRIRVYLEALCQMEDPRARGKPLHGNLGGFWRYRIGDYRVLVSIEDQRLVIVAIELGHRSQVYRR